MTTDENVTSLPIGVDLILLGHLESSDSGTIYPVSDQSPLAGALYSPSFCKEGRCPGCTDQWKVTLSVQGVKLVDVDSVQVGKQMFMWYKKKRIRWRSVILGY